MSFKCARYNHRIERLNSDFPKCWLWGQERCIWRGSSFHSRHSIRLQRLHLRNNTAMDRFWFYFWIVFCFFLFCLIWIDRVCFANRAVNFTGKKSMVYAKVISMEPKDVPEKPTFSRCNISKYFRGCELELIQFFAGDRADRLMRVQFEPVSKPFCFTRDTQKTVLYTGNWCDLMKSECIHLHKLINKFIATSKPVCSCDDIWQVP